MRSVSPGDCFYFDPTGGRNFHLWIVLAVYTPELSDEDFAVIVSITSMTGRADTTCVLRPDDSDAYEFVRHESYVYYEDCWEIEAAKLLDPAVQRRAPVPLALWTRVRNGLHRSPRLPRRIKDRVPRG